MEASLSGFEVCIKTALNIAVRQHADPLRITALVWKIFSQAKQQLIIGSIQGVNNHAERCLVNEDES